ncbi:hypothetical protein ACET3Z_010503 [Daucus carota]
MLGMDELKQVQSYLNKELTQLKEKNDALRAENDILQAKNQQLLNEVWRKVAEYNYPDFVHVVVPVVMEACHPPNCAVILQRLTPISGSVPSKELGGSISTSSFPALDGSLDDESVP